MINHIISSLKRKPGSEAVTYHYCDFSNPLSLDPCEIVGCLLRQLALQTNDIPPAIQNLYHKCSGQRPQLTMLCEVLEAVIKQTFEMTYLIIDGIDESPNRQVILDKIQQLCKASNTTNRLRILLASRPEYDIRQALSTVSSFPIEHRHVQHDMETHVRAELAKMPKLRAMPVHAQEDLIVNLVERSEGMFRWIQCQLDTLRKLRTPQAINQALQALPAGLDETYDRILISLDESDHEYVLRMLHWLVDSERPLSVTELAEAIALNPNKDRLDRAERLIVPEEVFELCGSLIRTDEDQNIVLAHYSVKEYLLSARLATKEQALAKFALQTEYSRRHVSMCLLSYFLSIGLTVQNLEHDVLDEDEYPLISYARNADISRFQDFDAMCTWMERHLVVNGAEGHDWLALLDFVRVPAQKVSSYLVGDIVRRVLQLSLMCFWNGHMVQCNAAGSNAMKAVAKVASMFLRLQCAWEDPRNASEITWLSSSGFASLNPLCTAAAFNLEHVMRFLLENGAMVDGIPSLQYLGNPLFRAIHGGNKEIVRTLAEFGADFSVRSPRRPGIILLIDAALRSTELVEYLLEEYAMDTNTVGPHGRTIVSDVSPPSPDAYHRSDTLRSTTGLFTTQRSAGICSLS